VAPVPIVPTAAATLEKHPFDPSGLTHNDFDRFARATWLMPTNISKTTVIWMPVRKSIERHS
jgi:hypothetical protein